MRERLRARRSFLITAVFFIFLSSGAVFAAANHIFKARALDVSQSILLEMVDTRARYLDLVLLAQGRKAMLAEATAQRARDIQWSLLDSDGSLIVSGGAKLVSHDLLRAHMSNYVKRSRIRSGVRMYTAARKRRILSFYSRVGYSSRPDVLTATVSVEDELRGYYRARRALLVLIFTVDVLLILVLFFAAAVFPGAKTESFSTNVPY